MVLCGCLEHEMIKVYLNTISTFELIIKVRTIIMLILTSFYFRRLTFLFSQVLFKHGLWRDLSRTEDVPFSLMFFNSSGRGRPILLGWQNEPFLGGSEGGAATLRRTLHEPWQHLFRFCMLLSSTMHQPTYGSIMICWTKVRCLNKFYLTSIRAQAYFVVDWTHF